MIILGVLVTYINLYYYFEHPHFYKPEVHNSQVNITIMSCTYAKAPHFTIVFLNYVKPSDDP